MKELVIDTLIVGAGPAGAIEALRSKRANPAESISLCHDDERLLGRATSGLHFINADFEYFSNFPELILSEKTFLPALIRWEKNWVNFNEVEWESEEWVAGLPQWSAYLRGSKKIFRNLSAEALSCFPAPQKIEDKDQTPAKKSKKSSAADTEIEQTPWVLWSEPVSKIERLSETSHYNWSASTANYRILAKRVLWCAGMTAFQNAFGKVEAQSYLTGNPLYQKEAADFLGGIALDIELAAVPQFEEGFNIDAVFALPVRHNSKLSLMIGVVDQDETSGKVFLRSLTHVHHEVLNDPKELLSFQKSLRRSLKHILTSDSAEAFEKAKEKWVVSPKIGAHMLGNPWCFKHSEEDKSLEFLGDQTFAAMSSLQRDILGALQSYKILTEKKSQELSPEL